jgi:hypothetical protein
VRDAARVYLFSKKAVTSTVIMDAVHEGMRCSTKVHSAEACGNGTKIRQAAHAGERWYWRRAKPRPPRRDGPERLTTYEAAMRRIGLLLAMTILAACGHPGYTEYSSLGVPFTQGDAECSYAAPKNVDISL